jgi:hypothetical protein
MAHEIIETAPPSFGELAANRLHLQRKGLPRGRPWRQGQSGNPAGKRPGTLSHTTRLTVAVRRGDVALIRRTAERALAGDPFALRACLNQILKPLREKRVPLGTDPNAA